jgi:hypothetical protein
MVQAIQIPVQVGDIAAAPGEGHHQDQQAKVGEMVPMGTGAEGAEELVQGGRNSCDAKQRGNSPEPMVSGRYIRSLSIHRGLPPLPRFVKLQPPPYETESVTMSG